MSELNIDLASASGDLAIKIRNDTSIETRSTNNISGSKNTTTGVIVPGDANLTGASCGLDELTKIAHQSMKSSQAST